MQIGVDNAPGFRLPGKQQKVEGWYSGDFYFLFIRAFDKVLRGLAVEAGLGVPRKEYRVGRVAWSSSRNYGFGQ